jgi:hypothetical protein
MWKTLALGQSVDAGDQVRYSDLTVPTPPALYQVVKTDTHYFEIELAKELAQNELQRKLVRYFDIGHTVALEIWSE